MQIKTLAVAALAALAVPAQAAVLFTDDFGSENGGLSALNYTGFANFTVEGQVDLVRSGDFGITCTGSCVDLDGSAGPGGLVSGVFTFNAGDTIELFLSVAGNQRSGSGGDLITYGFYDLSDAAILTGSTLLNWDQPLFTSSTGAWVAGTSGSFRFRVGTDSSDAQGPLLDDVRLEITPGVGAIPEPATWAMMIGGFALVGAAMRRRKVSVRFA